MLANVRLGQVFIGHVEIMLGVETFHFGFKGSEGFVVHVAGFLITWASSSGG